MKDLVFTEFLNSEIGWLEVLADDSAILSIYFLDEVPGSEDNPNEVTSGCVKQLIEYFEGTRQSFSLNLNPTGTEFQKKVWNELNKIKYGVTVSYLDVAKGVGDVKSIRAVGLANGKNKIPIIIPCHRVIGANGKLVGYGGGLWRKEWLLKHEQKFSNIAGTQLNLF